MQEKLARGKRGCFLFSKTCLLIILQLHHKGVHFFIILEVGIKILLNKDASKMGFSISCTTSHHYKSWQGRQKRDEKWKTVYHSRQVIYVGRSFYLFYPQMSPPFNTTGTFTVFIECLWYSQHCFWSSCEVSSALPFSPPAAVAGSGSWIISPDSCCQGSEPGGASPQWHSPENGRGFLSEYGLNIYNICTLVPLGVLTNEGFNSHMHCGVRETVTVIFICELSFQKVEVLPCKIGFATLHYLLINKWYVIY